MRGLVLTATIVMLVACTGNSPVPNPVTHCSEPRPQVCTMEYNPVCATLKDGATRQYASPCNACAHDTVASYLADVCPGPDSDAATPQK